VVGSPRQDGTSFRRFSDAHIVLGGKTVDELREQGVDLNTYANGSPRTKKRVYAPFEGDSPQTSFGQDVGIDADQVAHFLQKMPDRAKLWTKFVGDKKTEITKFS